MNKNKHSKEMPMNNYKKTQQEANDEQQECEKTFTKH